MYINKQKRNHPEIELLGYQGRGWPILTQVLYIDPVANKIGWSVLLIPIFTTQPNHWTFVLQCKNSSEQQSYDFFFADSLAQSRHIGSTAVMQCFSSTPLFEEARNDTWQTLNPPAQWEVECGAYTCYFAFLANRSPGNFSQIFDCDPYCNGFYGTELRDWLRSIISSQKMENVPSTWFL